MPSETSLSYIVKREKENRGDECLTLHWVHEYMNRGQIEFATGWSADSVNYWQNRLASQKLLKLWKRPTARCQYESSLTSRGESYLESLGYEYRGYAKSLAQSDKPQRKHWLQITSNSLGFLRAADVLGHKAEVFPGMTFAVRGREIGADKIWKADEYSFIVECERSYKDSDELEEKFQSYIYCVLDNVFAKAGLRNPRVLYITPTIGRIPKLLKAARKARMKALFYFTYEGAFEKDCTKLLIGKIWQLCDGEEVSL